MHIWQRYKQTNHNWIWSTKHNLRKKVKNFENFFLFFFSKNSNPVDISDLLTKLITTLINDLNKNVILASILAKNSEFLPIFEKNLYRNNVFSIQLWTFIVWGKISLGHFYYSNHFWAKTDFKNRCFKMAFSLENEFVWPFSPWKWTTFSEIIKKNGSVLIG